MTKLLTSEKNHETLSELCPFYDFAIITIEKILSTRYLENFLKGHCTVFQHALKLLEKAGIVLT